MRRAINQPTCGKGHPGEQLRGGASGARSSATAVLVGTVPLRVTNGGSLHHRDEGHVRISLARRGTDGTGVANIVNLCIVVPAGLCVYGGARAIVAVPLFLHEESLGGKGLRDIGWDGVRWIRC